MKQSHIAWASLAISIITAAVVIWERIDTREHHRLSAKPMVLADVTSSPLRATWGIFLNNKGTGTVELDYGPVMLDGHVSDMESVVNKMREEGVFTPNAKVAIDRLLSGSYLRMDERKPILEVDPQSVNRTALPKFIDFLRQRIKVSYEVCSVYDECERGCTTDPCVVSEK